MGLALVDRKFSGRRQIHADRREHLHPCVAAAFRLDNVNANRAAAIESGCIAYLTKPFTALSLIKPIENVRAAAA